MMCSQALPADLPPIRLQLHTRNPVVMVAAVRTALRRCHVDHDRIWGFTAEALNQDSPGEMRRVCERWAEIEIVP